MNDFFEGIGFENFRVFKSKAYFNLAPITLITGTNNSGKSGLLNGVKLLQENFRHIKKARKPSIDLNLESIMKTSIESGSQLEKYGTLKQFITKGENEKEFNFSFKRNMVSIDDVVEIIFKVKINDNHIKDALINNICMKSVGSDKTIFEIISNENTTNKYVLNLDFTFFYNAARQRVNHSISFYTDRNVLIKKIEMLTTNPHLLSDIKYELEEFNGKYKSSYVISSDINNNYFLDDLDEIVNYGKKSIEIEQKIFESILAEKKYAYELYDFSFLWANKPENKIAFEESLTTFYGGSCDENYILFNYDILKFLTDIDWFLPDFNSSLNDPGINFILNSSSNTLGIGLKKFIELFSNFRRHPGLIAVFGNPDVIEIYDHFFKSAIIKNEKFYKEIIVPLLTKISQLPTTENIRKTKLAYFDRHSVFDNLLPSEFEKLFSNLICDNLNLIQTSISGLAEFNFLPTNKIQNRRTYSLADVDAFALLIRKVEGMQSERRAKAYEFINNWLKEFEIADLFLIKHDLDTGNFKPYLKKGDEEMLMADFGYGTSKILPMLLKLIPEDNEAYLNWGDSSMYPQYNSRIVVLEEPEANLHPALQSKLADLFVESSKIFNIQILIETHSEYLIRKLQYLTASPKSTLKPEDTVIYYFYHPDKIPPGEDQVKKIKINTDGSLNDNFGAGFFDEADNIALELFLMNQNKNN